MVTLYWIIKFVTVVSLLETDVVTSVNNHGAKIQHSKIVYYSNTK